MSLQDQLLQILHSSEDGVSDNDLKQQFGDSYSSLVPIINELLRTNHIQLFLQGGVLFYRAIEEAIAAKLEGLGPEQMLVYQICEKAGNRGIWTRDIKIATNCPQHTLTKTLKILEQRNLIKSVRSVTSKSKKLYMLYDTVPAKDITGGPWYTDQEFDHEFVDELARFIVQFVSSEGMASVSDISAKVRISGISKIELSGDEIDLVLQTLVFDGKLEEVKHAVVALTGQGGKMYKVSAPIHPPNHYTAVPCGVCPVYEQCHDGGVISPQSCVYMSQWLQMSAEEGVSPIEDLF
mmetsp:Transcript_12258/g.18570  ORF Transcript_12258/g.18570 Transcript_12258/m.18570 type:complete len:293 (+) Transcript_12258:48-926(+)